MAFNLPHVYIIGKNHFADQWHYMFVSWHNKFEWNKHVIIQKDVRYLVNKFTHNTSLVVSPFLWTELLLITSIFFNNTPYLWHNFIIIYLIKVIRILALLRQIFLFFLKFFLKIKWCIHTWQPCEITCMVAQSSIVVHQLFIYYNVLL